MGAGKSRKNQLLNPIRKTATCTQVRVGSCKLHDSEKLAIRQLIVFKVLLSVARLGTLPAISLLALQHQGLHVADF